jgi:hypothetical protein
MMANDPMELVFNKVGGIPALVKWIKESSRNRAAFYSQYISRWRQPMVQNNVNVTVDRGEEARAHLETAFYRIIDARKTSIGDPACYVNGERVIDEDDDKEWIKKGGVIIDGRRLIEHQPVADIEPPQTLDAGVAQSGASGSSGSNSENLKSPKKGPLDGRGGVLTTPGETTTGAGTKQKSHYSISIPGLCAGAALDESADNRSTTEKYLSWSGHGKAP